MRLKSLSMTTATITTKVAANHRLNTCVAHILLWCLLSCEVWSYANIKHGRFVRQANVEESVNYEDSSMTNLYHQPHFTRNRSVIVQLFEWKFLDVAAECRNFLGPQGYAGVQLSPVLEHTVIKTSSLKHPWWERYEVISYRLSSRSGDESEFWSMTRICNDHGVRIYVDVVLNHMAAPLHFVADADIIDKDFIVNTTLEMNVNISQFNYSNVSYTQADFHRPVCVVLPNAQDAHEIRNCQLNGHPDLDHSRGGVQQHIVQMLNKFVDMGVAGFRIDTAKYIWPIDLKLIFEKVKNLNTEFNFELNARPFFYVDVFDLGLDSVSKTEYSTYGVVSEYLYAAELANIINGKVSLSSLINWGPALGFLPHEDSLVFIDSPDTQRGLPLQLGNNRLLTHKQRIKYIMANVFMLVHPYGGIKRIMSSYYFSNADINQGPPVMEGNDEEIRSPQFSEQQLCTKESGWVCEHRWPEIVSMLKVANYFQVPGQKENSIINFQSNGLNQVAFCRGHKAFVALNNDSEMDFEKEVFACLQPGLYCDMVTGGKKQGEEECHGKTLIINEQGYTKLQLSVADSNGYEYEEKSLGEEENEEDLGRIENYGILVIYVESKIQTKIHVETKEGAVVNPTLPSKHVNEIGKEETELEAVTENDEADEAVTQPFEADTEKTTAVEGEEEVEDNDKEGEPQDDETFNESPSEPGNTDADKSEETKRDEEVDEMNTETEGEVQEEPTEIEDEEKDEVEKEKNEDGKITSNENKDKESEGQNTEVTQSAENNVVESVEEGLSNQGNEEKNTKPESIPEVDENGNEANENDEQDPKEDGKEPTENVEDQESAVNNEETSKEEGNENDLDKDQKIEAEEDNNKNEEAAADLEENVESEAPENEEESGESELAAKVDVIDNETQEENKEEPEEGPEHKELAGEQEATKNNEETPKKEEERYENDTDNDIEAEKDKSIYKEFVADLEENVAAEASEKEEENIETESSAKTDVNDSEAQKEKEGKPEEDVNYENTKTEEIPANSEEKVEGGASENEEELKSDNDLDLGEGKQNNLDKENSAESAANEEATENKADKLEGDVENNQARNIISGEQLVAEEQLEKPSAEIIDDINEVSDAVTAKVKDIQTAGILPRTKGDGNSG